MTTNPETDSLPTTNQPDSIENEEPFDDTVSAADALRKKRRSGNSVDLTYRYHEPSEDELSWTEDEHGTRKRRKRKSSGVDDFKTGIVYGPYERVNVDQRKARRDVEKNASTMRGFTRRVGVRLRVNRVMMRRGIEMKLL